MVVPSVAGTADFIDSLGRLYQKLSVQAGETFSERIEAALARLQSEHLRILVVGEFSRGKSTFINALIGRHVLPSRINPTTACINVIRAGTPESVELAYADGRLVSHPLPVEKPSRFLDALVTTANAEAASIRTSTITVDSRIGDMCVEIIDTPGVNDLDASREEITFNYLRRADAAIVILDAQQPLSESERTFLRDKVIGSDVRRLVFVVNKVDEVLLSGGSVQDIARIISYARGRLHEMVGLADAEVHAVSARNALRARASGQPDPGPTSFADFETALIAFAQRQAGGRLLAHRERFDAIAADADAALARAEEDVRGGAGVLVTRQNGLIEREQAVLNRVDRIRALLGDLVPSAEARLAERIAAVIANARRDAIAAIGTATDDAGLAKCRVLLSQQLRDLADGIEQAAAAEQRGLMAAVAKLVPGLDRSARPRITAEVGADKLGDGSAPGAGDTDGANGWLVGAGLGAVSGFIFGPIGVAAAVAGSFWLSHKKEQQRQAQAAAQRAEAAKALGAAFDDLAARAADGVKRGMADASRLLLEAAEGTLQRESEVERAAIAAAMTVAKQGEDSIHARLAGLAATRQAIAGLRRSAQQLEIA